MLVTNYQDKLILAGAELGLVLPRLGLAWLGSAKHGLTKKGQAKPSQLQMSQLKPAEPGLSHFMTYKERGLDKAFGWLCDTVTHVGIVGTITW